MAEPKKVWVEINAAAFRHNTKVIRSHLSRKVGLWAVVKSNAYGHGIYALSKIADKDGVDGFCVDSVIEGLALRREKIRKPILVLGPTLPHLYQKAAAGKIAVTISNWEALRSFIKTIKTPARRPEVHLKIDTGMYRQGFYVSQLPEVIAFIREYEVRLTGIYSHLADSAETEHAQYTEKQYELFNQAVAHVRDLGFPDIVAHLANTAAALEARRYQFDAVRVGNALYGLYPSKGHEARTFGKLGLRPVLSWHAFVSEVKEVPAGEAIGYGRTRKFPTKATIALVPIGFWHGLPWELSNNGEVLVEGRRAPIVGRVSMDMVSLDVTGIPCKVGTKATFIGTQGKETITARQIAERIHTRPQEIVTRINPLIERVIV